MVTHHIQHRNDSEHNIDIRSLDKKSYFASVKKENGYPQKKKENLPVPSIKCLWCNYRNKVERDLEWHFLEKHKYQLYKMISDSERKTDGEWTKDSFSWMYADIDYRLYKAVQLAKEKVALGVT